MRIVVALGAIAILAVALSSCAVVSAGSTMVGAGLSVGTTVVSTAADVAADVISAPFSGRDDSEKKKD